MPLLIHKLKFRAMQGSTHQEGFRVEFDDYDYTAIAGHTSDKREKLKLALTFRLD